MEMVRLLGCPKKVGEVVARKRRKPDRIRQIYEWLQFSYPTPYPTKLKLIRGTKPRSDQGYVVLNGRHLVIYIDMKYPLHAAIDTVLHEYAHAVAWKHASMDAYVADHSNEWGLAFANIYRDFNDEGGDVESWEF